MSAYLISVSRGFRMVQELDSFKENIPNHLSLQSISTNLAPAPGVNRRGHLDVMVKRIALFSLRKKGGKEAWNKFARRLVVP